MTEDHPRIRGEHDHEFAEGVHELGSSPHTRGALQLVYFRVVWAGIIPAYAGSTDPLRAVYPMLADHPRIRGEHKYGPYKGTYSTGSSPHTRGARGRARVYPISSRIIPAYAGSTNGLVVFSLDPQDHPRIRGEHEGDGKDLARTQGSSPHTRGARG